MGIAFARNGIEALRVIDLSVFWKDFNFGKVRCKIYVLHCGIVSSIVKSTMLFRFCYIVLWRVLK